MDELIDFSALATEVDRACPRPDRSKGGRPPYATEVMVRMAFLQSLYNLSDEDCEHQGLDRTSLQRFCRLDGALHIPDARTLWSFKQRLALGGLGGRAIFEAVSAQLQQHGYLPRGGQIVDASIVQAPQSIDDLAGARYGYINKSCSSSYFPPAILLNGMGRRLDFLDIT